MLAATFEAGEWPWTCTVQRRFESWNAAILAAGLVPRPAPLALTEALPDVALADLWRQTSRAKGEARRQLLLQLAEACVMAAEALDDG
jgi:hypothetical protein